MQRAQLVKCEILDRDYCTRCNIVYCGYRNNLMYCKDALDWYNIHIDKLTKYKNITFGNWMDKDYEKIS